MPHNPHFKIPISSPTPPENSYLTTYLLFANKTLPQMPNPPNLINHEKEKSKRYLARCVFTRVNKVGGKFTGFDKNILK